MHEIGIKELKARASAIVRDVRQSKARYVVTYRGRPVSLLVPLEDPMSELVSPPDGSDEAAWDELVQLGEEIGRGWRSPKTSTELLSGMRR